MTTTRLRELALERGGLLAFVTMVLYIWLAPQHVVDGDNAEFATLSVTGGSAHPSGYPLYILWLRAMSWLPGVSPAHTAAIATALLGAAGVLVLHAACRAWGARSLAATLASASFATGPVVLRVVTEAEVFALNNLVVATVLWLSAARGPARGITRAGLLGLVAGLGLSDHLTCVLVAPVGLLGVVRGIREAHERGRAALLVVTMSITGLVLGLLPYVYLLVAPETPMSWGVGEGLGGIVGMFLRDDYGGPTAFRASGLDVSARTNIIALVVTLGRAWLWLPAATGLALLAVRCVRAAPDAEPRIGWAMLALSWLVAGPLLVTRFNVPPEGLGLYVNQRFHLLPVLLLAPAVAHAFELAFSPFRLARPRLVIGAVATIGIVALTAPSLSYLGRVHSPAVEASARNLLHSLPPNAVVIHAQDEFHAVPGYVQWALGERRDVRVVTWPLMTLDWYRARVAARGITSARGLQGPAQVQLVTTLLARGEPVFVDRLQRDVIASFPSHPYGILIRVLPRGHALPTVPEVFELNAELYRNFAMDYPRPGLDDEFATEVHMRYREIWLMIARMLERQGDRERSALAFELARAYGPDGVRSD